MNKGFGTGAVIVIVALILIIGGYMYYSQDNTITEEIVAPVETAPVTGEETIVTPPVETPEATATDTATTTQ